MSEQSAKDEDWVAKLRGTDLDKAPSNKKTNIQGWNSSTCVTKNLFPKFMTILSPPSQLRHARKGRGSTNRPPPRFKGIALGVSTSVSFSTRLEWVVDVVWDCFPSKWQNSVGPPSERQPLSNTHVTQGSPTPGEDRSPLRAKASRTTKTTRVDEERPPSKQRLIGPWGREGNLLRESSSRIIGGPSGRHDLIVQIAQRTRPFDCGARPRDRQRPQVHGDDQFPVLLSYRSLLFDL